MINFRFEIVEQIGKGRSEVYLCKDTDFNDQLVAVKFLPAGVSQEELATFRQEFFTLGKLDHPNIINAFEIGIVVCIDENDPVEVNSSFIVLEYFESTELLDSNFLSDEASLKEILMQVCSVLFYLHQTNYIYYDLKPENILVSSDSGSPEVKLIDLGFAEFVPFRKEHSVKGTAEYIAPELLKNEAHDFRVDLYSLGILLYRIIYKQLPFDNSEQLKIYKAQVEDEFDFPETVFSNTLVDICKRLLEKDPDERYPHSLAVISDLGFKIDDALNRYYIPAKVFSGREDFVNILSAYIEDRKSSELFSVKGFDGAGKSSLLEHLYEKNPGSILINNTWGFSGIDLVKYIVKRMIFSQNVFPVLNQSEKEKLFSFIVKPEKEYLQELHSVISIITSKSKFLILVDDFNLFDAFVKELILDLIPVWQINGVKIIISEASDFDYVSESLNNVREILVGSFTENQLTEYLQLAYYNLFPVEEIKNLILDFADLLPGNIIDFIKNLITLQILIYSKDGLKVNENHSKLSEIEGSLSAVYQLRLDNLSSIELNTVKAISCFENSLDVETLSKLLRIKLADLNGIIKNLQVNNVILPFNANPVPVIGSDGLKKHIYSKIDNKKSFHKLLAESIATSLPAFNKAEFARQFELANDFESALSVWNEEINNAFELAAFSYARNVLNHLLDLPIAEISKNDVRYKLVETLYKLSDHNSTLSTIGNVNIELLTENEILELYIIKGSSLVGTGKPEEGKELIESLIPKVNDELRKSTLLVEIAYAVFDLNEFEKSYNICHEILLRNEISDEDRGRIHNLLGMCSYYKDNNFKAALLEFQNALEYYEKVGLKNKVAAIEVNIGVMYSIIGDKKNAEDSWNKALELNRSVGNLSQEGVLLLNNGAYFYDELNFDKAIEYYKRAYNIFLSLGGRVNEGIALSNLGEVYFTTCEYQNAFEALEEAKILFEELENIEELMAVLVLFALFYFTIGEKKEIKALHTNTASLVEDLHLEDKYRIQLLLIKNLMLLAEEKEIEITELETIRENYLEKEDFKNYVTVNTILLNYLIKLEMFSKAIEDLKNESFTEASEQNNIFKANREYLLGVLSSKHVTDDALTSIEHFEKAYELLAEESIVELTWKVLCSLAVEYSNRGNINKAKNFIIYCRDLISLIAENIESTNFKTAYLQKEERRKSIKQLEKLQEV